MNNPPLSQELQAKVKKCDPQIQKLITAFQSELKKLRTHDAKLEVENLSLKMRIDAMKGQIEEYAKFRQNPLSILANVPPEELREFAKQLRETIKNKR
jgi:hypothetical protein